MLFRSDPSTPGPSQETGGDSDPPARFYSHATQSSTRAVRVAVSLLEGGGHCVLVRSSLNRPVSRVIFLLVLLYKWVRKSRMHYKQEDYDDENE